LSGLPIVLLLLPEKRIFGASEGYGTRAGEAAIEAFCGAR
jgi:hypothetical protein